MSEGSKSNSRPRVLVTGGRGRVASAIREELGGEHWDIIACSRTADAEFVSTESLLASTSALGVDVILDCAWSSVPASAGDLGGASVSTDLAGVQRWIDRLKAEPAPPLFVFMSSGAVYGPAPERPSREADEPKPQGAYAEAKLAAERLLLSSGLPVCILRVAPLYGLQVAAQTKQGVISHLVSAALSGTVFQQWGQNTVKDYLHREDFCEALRLIVDQRLSGDLWNLGSGVATHLTDLVTLVESATSSRINIDLQPAPAWDVQDNRLDISKLQAAISWEPKISLEAGIAREVQRLRA